MGLRVSLRIHSADPPIAVSSCRYSQPHALLRRSSGWDGIAITSIRPLPGALYPSMNRIGRSPGPRNFQVLVDKKVGSSVVAQFIGHIPISKAAPHRHLYDETLVVLSGEGYMLTENLKTRVHAGDVLLLPGKQLHSLECVSKDGMDIVRVICPSDNPSIT